MFFAALFSLVDLPSCVLWAFAFLILHILPKLPPLWRGKTLYIASWALLASLLLVFTASLTSHWVPRWSVRGCITFNGLVLIFTETINLCWRYRFAHGRKLCLGSFFSARYVSCFLVSKVVALRDYISYVYLRSLCQIRRCLALFRPASHPGTRSVGWQVLPL